jgi:hypothetical protein
VIVYWAWPQAGSGHAVRAAAICRWLDSEFVVIRGNGDPEINRSLDHFDIPYIVEKDKDKAFELVRNIGAKTVVVDDRANADVGRLASMFIWRLGRPLRGTRGKPMIKIEGPGSLFPVLMLEDREILTREEAREDLGLDQNAFIKVGVTSIARPGAVESLNPDLMLEAWPALKWLACADHVVGCIGANLYGEVTYLGLPVTWIKAPEVKDQAVRIYDPPVSPITINASQKIAQIIEDTHARA